MLDPHLSGTVYVVDTAWLRGKNQSVYMWFACAPQPVKFTAWLHSVKYGRKTGRGLVVDRVELDTPDRSPLPDMESRLLLRALRDALQSLTDRPILPLVKTRLQFRPADNGR